MMCRLWLYFVQNAYFKNQIIILFAKIDTVRLQIWYAGAQTSGEYNGKRAVRGCIKCGHPLCFIML